MEITFGKHKGEQIADLPLSYLEWLLAEGALDGDEWEEAFTGIALRIREKYARARERYTRRIPRKKPQSLDAPLIPLQNKA